jgi:hypothetical protein
MRAVGSFWRLLVPAWIIFTVVFFAVISLKILHEPDFPLGITFVDTRGLAGLWITVPSFLQGGIGLVLLIPRRAAGAKWLLAYSTFWAASLLFGAVEKMRTLIGQPLHVCLTGACATLPVTLAILAAFVACVYCYWPQAFPKRV